MATAPQTTIIEGGDPTYPSGDGKPMAESDLHWDVMVEATQALKDRYADEPDVYIASNLMMFYEPGNKRRHVAPDLFVVFGVPKLPLRLNYIVWQEGKGPDLVIETTSKTTWREDQKKKFFLYRDVLKVPEYFQFDAKKEYLKPSLQGHTLVDGEYVPIEPDARGRLYSRVLDLYLERDGEFLRFVDPATGRRLPTRAERADAEAERADAEAEARGVEAERARRAEAENERLRREMEELRRRLGQRNGGSA